MLIIMCQYDAIKGKGIQYRATSIDLQPNISPLTSTLLLGHVRITLDKDNWGLLKQPNTTIGT